MLWQIITLNFSKIYLKQDFAHLKFRNKFVSNFQKHYFLKFKRISEVTQDCGLMGFYKLK